MHSGNECDHVPSDKHTGGLASSGSGNTYPARHVIFSLSPGAYQNFSGMMRPLDGSPGYSHLALPAENKAGGVSWFSVFIHTHTPIVGANILAAPNLST